MLQSRIFKEACLSITPGSDWWLALIDGGAPCHHMHLRSSSRKGNRFTYNLYGSQPQQIRILIWFKQPLPYVICSFCKLPYYDIFLRVSYFARFRNSRVAYFGTWVWVRILHSIWCIYFIWMFQYQVLVKFTSRELFSCKTANNWFWFLHLILFLSLLVPCLTWLC